MPVNQHNYQSALDDFTEARLKANLQEVLARLTGRSNELLSYEEVAEKLKLNVRTEAGVHEIPVKAIVGSVSRFSDFTRSFLPRKSGDQSRWAHVKAAVDDPGGMGMPPIEVYKVGEVYFVLDGNHRVSVARGEGFEFIEAHVIEVKTDIPVTPDIQPDDLIIKSEYAEFLQSTDIAVLRPGVDLSVSVPGQYIRLLEHIQVHRYFMGIDFRRDIPFSEAVAHWYDTVYLPMIQPIRERGLLRWFPHRTETDLYLWVSEHRAALEKELGWSVRPDAAMTDLASHESSQADLTDTGSWRLAKMFDRYTDRLFRDILVSMTGVNDNCKALDQAIVIAKKEEAVLHGLHVIPENAKRDEGELQVLERRFDQCCRAAQVKGSLAIDHGRVAHQVCERALLTDLVVLNLSHPPLPGLSSLNSGLRAIIRNSARPILAVPGEATSLDRILLAYDGSPKSKEALFVATYLSEKWKASLKVLTLSGARASLIQAEARSYLELHEVRAEFVIKNGPQETILKVIKEDRIDLVLLGGYSGTTLKELLFGSMVNLLLRRADCPVLICR
jgi:nucleotide-binding universal stress UspA family protein